LELLGLAIVLFASTNVDDLFVLVGFFADPKFRPRDVITGQYYGIGTLFGLSVVGSLLALVVPRAYVGLFGIVPIALGAKKLFDLYRKYGEREKIVRPHDHSGRHTRIATVTLVTVANGADNIGIYMPAFAIRTGYEIGVFALVFVLMTGLWCFFAHRIVDHPTFGMPIRRYGYRVTPLVLIGVGVLIMYEAGSFGLLFHDRH
jgi:cadmium resistance protein CadD (predicted permease)